MLRRLFRMGLSPLPPSTLTVTHPLPNFITSPLLPANGPMAISTIFLGHWILGREFSGRRRALSPGPGGVCVAAAICPCSLRDADDEVACPPPPSPSPSHGDVVGALEPPPASAPKPLRRGGRAVS